MFVSTLAIYLYETQLDQFPYIAKINVYSSKGCDTFILDDNNTDQHHGVVQILNMYMEQVKPFTTVPTNLKKSLKRPMEDRRFKSKEDRKYNG